MRPAKDKPGLEIRVVPGAKRNAIGLASDGTIKVRLQARAVDGKANAALISLLAKHLDVPERNVAILFGEHSRQKVIAVHGIANLKERLSANL